MSRPGALANSVAMTTSLRTSVHRYDKSSHPNCREWRSPAWAIWRESRPPVQVIFLLRLLAGSEEARQQSIASLAVISGWVCVTIAIYVYNGVTDVVGDMANGSTRPIASGRLPITTALSWSVALSLCGVLLCSVDGDRSSALVVLMLALGWAYSSGPALKESPTGFASAIGLGAGLTYFAGWLSCGGHLGNLLIDLGMAAWVGLACVAKDFSDVDGDRLAGRRTWPVILGARRAAWLAASLDVASAGALLAGSVLTGVDIAAGCALCAGSLALAVVLVRSATLTERSMRRRPYRVFMLTQYAVNLVLIAMTG